MAPLKQSSKNLCLRRRKNSFTSVRKNPLAPAHENIPNEKCYICYDAFSKNAVTYRAVSSRKAISCRHPDHTTIVSEL